MGDNQWYSISIFDKIRDYISSMYTDYYKRFSSHVYEPYFMESGYNSFYIPLAIRIQYNKEPYKLYLVEDMTKVSISGEYRATLIVSNFGGMSNERVYFILMVDNEKQARDFLKHTNPTMNIIFLDENDITDFDEMSETGHAGFYFIDDSGQRIDYRFR